MPRLIDADALLAQFYKDAVRLDGVGTPWDMSAINLEIESSPTIDAVEVVRCKDCKHLRESLHRKGETTCPMWGAVGLNPWGFCNLGERKDVE